MSCYSCTDSILIATSRILSFETLYLDAASLGMSDPWTAYITALRRSLWLMLTIIRECNGRVFARPGLGDLNDENPLKGADMCW